MPNVPHLASPSTAAAAKVIEVFGLVGSPTSNTRFSANSRQVSATPVFSATAFAIRSRARSAAWIAAWPIINVTRLE